MAWLRLNNFGRPAVEMGDCGQQEMQLQPQHAQSRPRKKSWTGIGIDVLWWDGYDHADVFDKQQDRAALVDVLVNYVKGS